MRRLVPLASALLFIGCSESDPGGCTLVACSDSATVTLQRSDGAPLDVPLEIRIGDEVIQCAAPSEQPTDCEPRVTVRRHVVSGCPEQEGTDSEGCEPTVRHRQEIQIRAAPDEVTVTVLAADGTRQTRVLRPEYDSFRPNGPDCEPECRQGSAEWTLDP